MNNYTNIRKLVVINYMTYINQNHPLHIYTIYELKEKAKKS